MRVLHVNKRVLQDRISCAEYRSYLVDFSIKHQSRRSICMPRNLFHGTNRSRSIVHMASKVQLPYIGYNGYHLSAQVSFGERTNTRISYSMLFDVEEQLLLIIRHRPQVLSPHMREYSSENMHGVLRRGAPGRPPGAKKVTQIITYIWDSARPNRRERRGPRRRTKRLTKRFPKYAWTA